jgi:hypothetical protein
MTSKTNINVNTVHLVPFAAVWQAPKIIRAAVSAAVMAYLFVFFTGSLITFLGNTTIFNKQLRTMMENYELCLADFNLQGPHSNKDMEVGYAKCYAQAKKQYLLTKRV